MRLIKRVMIIIVMIVFVVGCQRNWLGNEIERYLSKQGIEQYDILIENDYNDEFEFAIYKARGLEQIYLTSEIIIDGSFIYRNLTGESMPLYKEEGLIFRDYDSTTYESEGNYLLGIVFDKLEEVSYNGKTIPFQEKTFTVNNQEETISCWVYEYDEVDEDLFEIVKA